jgi:uncharacterized membrane protein
MIAAKTVIFPLLIPSHIAGLPNMFSLGRLDIQIGRAATAISVFVTGKPLGL